MPKGILVDYEWCSGCHSCEMACQVEKDVHRKIGVHLTKVGPYEIEGGQDDWVWINMPVFTDECDLCAARVEKGKKPTCVQHCQAAVLTYGEVFELAVKLAEKPKQTLFCIE